MHITAFTKINDIKSSNNMIVSVLVLQVKLSLSMSLKNVSLCQSLPDPTNLSNIFAYTVGSIPVKCIPTQKIERNFGFICSNFYC